MIATRHSIGLPALGVFLAGAVRLFAAVDVSVTAATGGGAISADTAGGAYTTLSGPRLVEASKNGIGLGSIILTAPTGFQFNPTATVTVAVAGKARGTDLVLSNNTATVTTNTIRVDVISISSGSRKSRLTWSGIQVRPTSGWPLASGNITNTGSASFTESGSAGNYGPLAEVPGTMSNLAVTLPHQTFAAGSGPSGTVTTQTAGVSFNITKLTAADRSWNIVSNYAGAKIVGYIGPGGSPTFTTNVTFTNGQSSTTLATTLFKAETTTITANDGTTTGPASSQLTVKGGAFTKLQLLLPGETAAPGTATGKTGVPLNQTAGTVFTVTVQAVDSYWNLANTVTDRVAIAASDAYADLPTNTVLTAGTGVFSVTLLTAGMQTVTVSDVTTPSVTSNASPPLTVNPAALQKLQLLLPGETAAPGTVSGKTGTPTAQVAGTSFTATVNAVDAYWNVVPVNDFAEITSSDPNAVLPANAALESGRQTFVVTLITAGDSTLTATDLSNASVTNNTSPSITVSAGPFEKLQLLVPGETAAPGSGTGKTGTPIPQSADNYLPVMVRAVDNYWNPVNTVSDTVHFTSSDGAATLPSDGALACGSNTFSVSFHTVGSQTLTVSDVTQGAKGACTSAVISVGTGAFTPATGGSAISADTAGGAYTSLSGPAVMEGSPGNVDVGTIVLTVPSGFVVNTGNTVFVTVTGSGSGSDTILASPTATVTSAAITVTVTAPSSGGRKSTLTWAGIQVRPSAGTPLAGGAITNSGTSIISGAPPGSNLGTLTAVPGAAARLSIQTQPSAMATAGVVFAQQPVVRVEDQFGNLRSTDNSTVTTAARSAGAGTLQGTLSAIAVSGVASFIDLFHATAGTMTVRFTAPGLTGTTSSNIVVRAAPQNQLAFVQPPTNAVAGATLSPAVTVQLRDIYGNDVTNAGVSVSVSLSSGSGTLSGTTTNLTSASGLATFSNLSMTASGPKTLTAASTGLTSSVSGTFTISPALPSQLAFVQPPTNAVAGAAISPAVTVQLRDTYGNDVTNAGVPVSVSLSSGSGTLSGTTTNLTSASGLATFGDLSIAAAGSKVLTASSTGLTPAVSGAFSISPADYTSVQILVPGETAAPGTATGKTGTPLAQKQGTSFTVRVNAVDAFWNVITTVTNTVDLYSSDGNPVFVPSSTGLVAGTATFSVILNTVGDQTVSAEDLIDMAVADDMSPPITVAATIFALQVLSDHGTSTPPVGAYTYAANASLTNSVTTPDTQSTTQYVCTGWTMASNVPLSGSTNSFTMTITNNSVLTWKWTTNYWLATGTNGNGIVHPASAWQAEASNVAVTASNALHWHFTEWSGDTQGCVFAANVLTAAMTRARSITATFEIDQQTITASAGPNGTIAPSGTVAVLYGGTTNFVMTPAADYHIADVLVDGISVGPTNAYTFANITNNRMIAASFTIDTTVRITNLVNGVRLPFRATQCTIAGRSVNVSGTMWYTNSWGRGTANGTFPAAPNWSFPLHLPVWGTYSIAVYGTNTAGDAAEDHVTIIRNRNQVFWFAR